MPSKGIGRRPYHEKEAEKRSIDSVFNSAAKSFREHPSATNWRALKIAMYRVQHYFNKTEFSVTSQQMDT